MTQFHLNRRTIVANITTLFSGSAAAQGMTALALLLTARQLGATTYGQYAACFALTSFTSILFNLGLDIWLLREGGRSPAQLSKYTGGVFWIKISGGLVWFAILMATSPFLDSDTYPTDLLLFCAIAVWLDSLLLTILTSFKTSLNNRITMFLESGSDALWLLATLSLIAIGSQDVLKFIQIRTIALILSLGIGLYLIRRIIGLSGSITIALRALRETPSFATSEFLAWTTMRVDVIIISFALGTSAVGLYSPAIGLVNMTFVVPAAVYMVMVPVLSNLYEANRPQMRKSSRNTVLLSLGIGVGLAVILYSTAPLVVLLLGESYQETIDIIRILSPLLIFKSVSFALAAIIVSSGDQPRRPYIQAIAVSVNITLNLIIVGIAGITGVAVVYVITEIIILAGYSWLVWTHRRRPSQVSKGIN